jgi:LSD1 subclass zinc finger protein
MATSYMFTEWMSLTALRRSAPVRGQIALGFRQHLDPTMKFARWRSAQRRIEVGVQRQCGFSSPLKGAPCIHGGRERSTEHVVEAAGRFFRPRQIGALGIVNCGSCRTQISATAGSRRARRTSKDTTAIQCSVSTTGAAVGLFAAGIVQQQRRAVFGEIGAWVAHSAAARWAGSCWPRSGRAVAGWSDPSSCPCSRTPGSG